MSFLFASSHLPASRVRRPELEDEDNDENREAMPRSGGVRASSHLRAEEGNARTTQSQMPDRLLKARPKDLRKQDTDGVAAAKASGVFDVVREQYNRSDSSHYMDEDGNLRPRLQSRTQAVADAPPQTATHAPDDTSSWHRPPLTHQDLRSLGLGESAFGSHATFSGSPLLNDIGSRPRGGSTPGTMVNDIVNRYNDSPEDAKKQNWSLYQNAAAPKDAPPVLHFTPAIPETNRDSGTQRGVPSDIDWANASPQKKEPLFPKSAERRMTEQERSLAELGENANLDSLHELHEWNKAVNEGIPPEDKPKPNPPLLPRRVPNSEGETVRPKAPQPVKLSGMPPAFNGPVLPGQKRVSEKEMQSHLADILNHAKTTDFDRGGKYHDQRYVETAHGPVDLKHIIASGTPFSALTILPATGAWETSQWLNKKYRQSAFAPEDLRSNAIGAGASDKSWPEFMSGKTFGDEAARLIGKMGFNSLPYGR